MLQSVEPDFGIGQQLQTVAAVTILIDFDATPLPFLGRKGDGLHRGASRVQCISLRFKAALTI